MSWQGILRQVWDRIVWLYCTRANMVLDPATHAKVRVCQDFSDSLDERARTNSIMIDFRGAFNLVLHNQQITKILASGMDMRVDVWVREFLSGHPQRFRVAGQLYVEVTVTSGVPQGNVLGPLLFLMYVNYIWRYVELTIRLFTGKCIIYRKIKDAKDVEKLQIDLDHFREWALENEMKINPGKIKQQTS
jgi:hypothetical protein